MATLLSSQVRSAGDIISGRTPCPRIKDNEVVLTFDLDAADIADPNFTITTEIQANNSPGNVTDGWYNIQGPNGWNGGIPSKQGGFITPNMSFVIGSDLPAVQIRCRFVTNKQVRCGLDASFVSVNTGATAAANNGNN